MTNLDHLVGQTVSVWTRAVEMLCIEFGGVAERSPWGNLSEFSIHCECSWRVLDSENKIVTASSEVYEPPSGVKLTNDFKWDLRGGNLLDEKIANILLHEDMTVVSIDLGLCDDLRIVFSNGMIFETFSDSAECEYWRYIDRRCGYDSQIAANSMGLVAGK